MGMECKLHGSRGTGHRDANMQVLLQVQVVSDLAVSWSTGTGARGHGGRGWAGEGRAVFASVSKEKVKSPYNLVDKMVCPKHKSQTS